MTFETTSVLTATSTKTTLIKRHTRGNMRSGAKNSISIASVAEKISTWVKSQFPTGVSGAHHTSRSVTTLKNTNLIQRNITPHARGPNSTDQ